MHVETYDPITGNIIESSAISLDFGEILQNQHSSNPLVIRLLPDLETDVTNLQMFLEDTGGWSLQCGYYTNPAFVPGIRSGDSSVFGSFVEIPDASSASPHGIPIGITDSTSDYIWLDADLSPTQTGMTDINYRFIFDHS